MAKKHKGSKGNQNLPEKSGAVDHNTTRSNRDGGLNDDGGSGGGGGDGSAKSGAVDHNSSRSNRDGLKDDGGSGGGGGDGSAKSGAVDHNTTRSNRDGGLNDDGGSGGGGGDGSAKSGAVDHNSSRSNRDGLKDDGGSGGGGPDAFGYRWMPTITSAVKVITAALLLVTVAAGADIYQTYNDAIAIDLEKHITDADFELSKDKSEISGSVGFDIPEMGLFEKSIIASVHVTVLESNPTTDGDYEFEYTLGSGEHFYDFTLDDLDPVTVEKIEAGQPLDIEYSGTISVTYLGIEIPSVTMDIPLTTTTVETA